VAGIPTSYTYTDGSELDTDGHNTNVYSTDSSGEGIMSEANGGLDGANLDAGFKVYAEHIQPGEVTQAAQEAHRETVDCWQDVFARTPTDVKNFATVGKLFFVPVPGCGIRFYQPYDASYALLSVSFFASHHRPVVGTNTGSKAEPVFNLASSGGTPGLGLVACLDTAIIDHTRRHLAFTNAIYDGGTGTLVGDCGATGEKRATPWYDLCHLMTGGLSKGYHDLQLYIYMEEIDADQGLNVTRAQAAVIEITAKFYQRCSFGVRSARVLSFL
jgi:hypothetical protein